MRMIAVSSFDLPHLSAVLVPCDSLCRKVRSGRIEIFSSASKAGMGNDQLILKMKDCGPNQTMMLRVLPFQGVIPCTQRSIFYQQLLDNFFFNYFTFLLFSRYVHWL